MQPLPRRLALLAILAIAPSLLARVQWVDVPAPSMHGNLLGTPEVLRAAVYLPPSYDTAPQKRYPVIYLLHGIFDRPETWVEHFGVPAILDRVIASGRMPEAIVVMPMGSNAIGGGFYRNSPVAGGWGDHLRKELVGFVDGSFRTIADRNARAIAGHSMGGFGAIWHAMTSAEVFSVAYAMSPALLGLEADLTHGNSAAWDGMLTMGGMSGVKPALERRDFWPVAAWAVCTSFLPNPKDETYLCDPPYRAERGELLPVEPAIDRFHAVLPIDVARDHVAALRSMRAIALDYGVDDQFAHIPATTQEMSRVLAELRVPHELHVYRGDHRNQVTARLEQVIFPWIGAQLRTP